MRFIVAWEQEQWMKLFIDGGVEYVHRTADISLHAEDVLFDLRDEAWDMDWYTSAHDNLVFVLSTIGTLRDHHAPPNIVRINSWSDASAQTWECAAAESWRANAEQVLQLLGKRVEWVPDVSGMVSPRVIAMIINEAWMTLEEGVSSRNDIDIAMKLGTNYPYGPFEWCEKIGAHRVAELLQTLSRENKRYEPAALLLQHVHGSDKVYVKG